jgi:3-isopropylmalate/(R)-2-methylmalate dehydratase large subunit
LEGRPYAPKGDLWERALASWASLSSDEGAPFAAVHRFEAGAVRPMVTWGTSPQDALPLGARVPALGTPEQARALGYMGLSAGDNVEGLPIDAAFIGSCTNSRMADLRRAARIVAGRKVAPGVKAIVVPGSTAVKAQAEAEGLAAIFTEAGFEWREAGCSMCFFAGGEHFDPQARVISSTNRNFESRQGPNTRTHLASPETVAASAIAGRITRAAAGVAP